MSLLKNLVVDESIANEKDSVGGSRVLESGLYDFTVEHAYVTVADSGAQALNLSLTSDNGNMRAQLWMTSGKEKGNKNYYEKDGVKNYLPGFNHANALCLLTIGKPIAELDTDNTRLHFSVSKKIRPSK